MKINKLFKVPVGDWSKDGHNQSTDFYVTANYPVEIMREAYKNTCKKIGLQMNNNINYTGIKNMMDYDSGERWRMLLAEYEQSSIPEEAVEILLEYGFDFATMDGERDENDNLVVQDVYFGEEGVVDLFMWFVSYGMPKDFKYERIIFEAEPIVGYWNSGLNHQIGYGVFSC